MFGDSGLVMSTYSTERDSLLGLSNGCTEGFRVEDSVVSVIVTYSYAMGLCVLFKALLGLNGFLCVRGVMHMDIGKAGNMVDKYCSSFVSLTSKSASILRNKAGDSGVQLVNGNDIAGLGGIRCNLALGF